MGFPFEKLDVYQRAVTLGEQIHAACDAFPAKGSFALADQLRRLATNLPGEIANATALWPKAERRRGLEGARAAALCCVPAVEIAARRGLMMSERKGELLAEIEVVSRMLAGMLKATQDDAASSAPVADLADKAKILTDMGARVALLAAIEGKPLGEAVAIGATY